MTAIERTAYPHFKKSLTQSELDEFYSPTEVEAVFVNIAASGHSQSLYSVLFNIFLAEK